MFKRQHYMALGLVGLLTVVVLNLPGHTVSQIKLALSSLFLPLFGLAKSAQQVSDKAGDAITPRSELVAQNDKLRHENEQLRVLAMRAEATAQENERLRQFIGWQKQSPWKLRLAKVIVWDPANWWRSVQIDLGKRDGMQADLPVLTADGLAGKISSVGLTTSQVALIGNPDCRVAARIEKTRETGIILTGSGPVDSTLVKLSYLSKNSVLKPGEVVVTSGEGGIFPPGILIGQVADSSVVDFGMYTEARVKLSVKLDKLEEVWVLIGTATP
ncbi:MAG TPA: rod shape-determining protein MreC [Verrucomicrobiae bacterium]|nr:rod shape-determining protein MreC [Verrucomicrobiae bacterium]